MDTVSSGDRAISASARRVIVPPCQWYSTRPVFRISGKRLDGVSSGRRPLIEAHELGARSAREVALVQEARAGVVRGRAGPLDAAFFFKPVVGYAADYRHERRHFVEYLRRMRVVEFML